VGNGDYQINKENKMRRVSFRVSILIKDNNTVKRTRRDLQEFLRVTIGKYSQDKAWQQINSTEVRLHNIATSITANPDFINVTHLRESLSWKRRILRWFERKLS
jgi:hypothetical protein